VNAWFVIERGTPGWSRLRKDGYKRVVPHGGLLWKLLMLNCDQLISSHADLPVSRPSAITRLAPPTWRFTFLQHGVIKDDLARWLNPKDVDIFVVSTHGEYHSIVDDGTGYRYTTREVQLTGLPRFDKVLEAGKKYPPDRRDVILIAPTWRMWLVSKAGDQRWGIDTEQFRRSDFAQNWNAVLRSEKLQAVAERCGLELGVLMHPNLQSVAPALDLPPSASTFGFEDSDVRELFARARVVVTDYSSMAFNAAYIERPIVYFQFDRDRMFGGGHVGRGGYFDYERDGYGPVTFSADDAVAAVVDAIEFGAQPRPEYLQRINDAFPVRDGNCCERVYQAIRQSSRKVARPAAVTNDVADGQDLVDVMLAEEVAVDETIAAAGDVDVPGGDPAIPGEPVQGDRSGAQ
jgi:hypothetical protein